MRVLKRKKGNKEYYYLQHSYRKGTKVITKEKYLGKEIPKNIEEIKNTINKSEEEIINMINKSKQLNVKLND